MPSAISFGDTGSTNYVKPQPETTPWAGDLIVGDEDASTGRFEFSGLTSGVTYRQYQQLGGSPAPSDLYVGDLLPASQIGLGLTIVTNQQTIVSDEIQPIVIGDDYLATNNRAIDVYIDPVAGVSLETATCTFGGETPYKGSWLVTGALAAVTINDVPKWRMRFQLVSADTIDCKPGCFLWSATLLSAGNRITRVQGEVQLVESQTIPQT
jgi:hypothetical protein